jgi:glutamate transport system permease protein
MLPIIIAQLVVLLKDTSLAFILGYNELINVGLRQGPTTFGAKYLFTLFFVVWAIYLIINMGLSWIARLVARRTARGGKPGRRGRKAQRVIAQLGGAGVAGAAAFADESSRALYDPSSSTDATTGNEGGGSVS